MQEPEIWRDVPGFGGYYQASSRGRIRVKRRVVIRRDRWGRDIEYVYRPRILRPHLTNPRDHGNKYKHVSIGWDRKTKSVPVHTMVLLAFVGQRPKGMVACHNNSVSTDNRPDNLRWDTHASNMKDRHELGRYARGEAHPMNKFSDKRLSEFLAMRSCEAIRAGISKTHYYRVKKEVANGLRNMA